MPWKMAEGTKHLILGSAGHVDHGKTTLIKAMTGINPDRLKEEQERGLTIDLGFAHITLPCGIQVSIIDVPGHERFLKNMLAGAGCIDIAMLVIAADEGVMPQTREHLEILEILETKYGVVALTKIDMVEKDWVDLVEDDVRAALQGTFLADSPIVRVSGVSGDGVQELIGQLDRMAREIQQRSIEGPFRMPVDRVFTITGFGTVVTGSLVSGTLHVGDPIRVQPQNVETRARQIEVHGKKMQAAYAGTRVAVNLAGLDTEDLGRGSVLVPPGFIEPTKTLDASVAVLRSSPKPITNRLRVRVHIGSAEVLGRVVVLGQEQIAPGEKGLVQIRLESPVAAARGDRFVLRLYSPTYLLGGGVVLDPRAGKHKRMDEGVVGRLEHALEGDPVQIVEDVLASAPAGLVKVDLIKRSQLPEASATSAIQELKSAGKVIEQSGRVASLGALDGASARVRSVIEAYHKANSTKPGMPKEELRGQLGSWVDQKGFAFLIGMMAQKGEIVASEATVRMPDHKPTLSGAQQTLAAAIERDYLTSGANPPFLADTLKKHGPGARDIIALLVDEGKLIRINPEIIFHTQALADAESALRAYLTQHGQITVAEFRDVISSSRKYVVPLLEYFDDHRVTERQGDLRCLGR
jgi:selenocysteine-specific elongation factor